MAKISNLLMVLAISLFDTNLFAQTNRQEFPTLNAQLQFNFTTTNVSSGVRFVDNLISDKALAAMDEDERKLGYASIYEYTYTFKNTGNTKIRVLFTERNLLMSPLINILQDFYLTLEPNEEKTIRFLANTTPSEAGAGVFIMQFVPNKNKWFASAAGQASFWLPRWNAMYMEVSY